MKRIAPLVFVAIIAVLAFSCSKEDSIHNDPASSYKIKTYSEALYIPGLLDSTESFALIYDNHDRIIHLQSTTSPGTRIQYTYSGDQYVMEFIIDGHLSIHNTCYLNHLSLVDSSIQYEYNDTTITRYIYNDNKQLVQQHLYDYTKFMGAKLFKTITYTYDVNGLLAGETDGTVVTTYKYDRVINNTVNAGMPYMPLPKQLPTQAIHVNGLDTETTDYTYNFDSKNRLIDDVAVESNGVTRTRTYTYF